jgi:hypothetical protein
MSGREAFLWPVPAYGTPERRSYERLRDRLVVVERERDQYRHWRDRWHDAYSREYVRAVNAEAQVARLSAASEPAEDPR